MLIKKNNEKGRMVLKGFTEENESVAVFFSITLVMCFKSKSILGNFYGGHQ